MKILLVHNRYKQYGGEDATFETEKFILETNLHEVKTLIFDNNEFDGIVSKIKLGIQLFYNRKSAKAITEIIKSFKPDIIHIHNFFYTASPSVLIAAYKNRVPVIVTLQNYRLICSGSLLMRNFSTCELCVNKTFPLSGIRYGCHRGSKLETAHLTLVTGIHKLMNTWNKKVSRYIAVTEFARGKYINSSLNLEPDKVVIKPSSVVDVEPSASHERENHFLYVGRLSEEKGIRTLLSAFSRKQFTLEIIGDGPLKPLVEEVVTNNPNIRYLGYRDKSFILSRLKKSAALIVSSVWYECLPITILEAFSTGTPVIISDIGNLNEIVSHNYNGLHFKLNNSEDLFETVKDFSENHSQYLKLYENARRTYVENYSPEINYNNLIRIYSDTIRNYSLQDKLPSLQ